tara:strand:- start:285 stop:770 length:486 start_codon:yes stop_codon:yes gene_type:complete
MIDIALAASGAIKAYELLRKGIDKGKEIEDMSGTVRAFFKSKHEVEKGIEQRQKANNDNPLVGSSLEEAVEHIEELEAIKRAEERIKWMYINAGKSALWGKIKREAERRDRIKAKAKAAAALKSSENAQLIKDLLLVLGLFIGGIFVTAGIIYLVFSGSLD